MDDGNVGYAETTQGLTQQGAEQDEPRLFDEQAEGERSEGGDEQPAEQGEQGAVSPDEHSLDELKSMAGELGLPTSGTKAELAERVNAKLAE
ncbi:SAP domain-containing protein [Prauserella endophytica]|uniref:SAP domain-containing protein n=1 Tax=Prauserella endophytica TaxID=1592324 RepID=A0ABY2S053_9PSEU|nr:SAP domain-containing protein [Prauserella endophytica]TKG66924.1 hypothetical protein FCN18_23720 [Prauserella endophytica]